MVKANRIQEKVAGAGFDWENTEQVFDKVQEEFKEFHTEKKLQNKASMEAEFGDVLFSLINYARFVDINPEDALERTNKKFISRFQYLEKKVKISKKSINELSLTEMNKLWEASKKLHP